MNHIQYMTMTYHQTTTNNGRAHGRLTYEPHTIHDNDILSNNTWETMVYK